MWPSKLTIETILGAVWKARSRKVDWLALEALQRDIFEGLAAKQYSQQEALCYLAESLEAFTRRGPVATFDDEAQNAVADATSKAAS